jgi:hypothetical protein
VFLVGAVEVEDESCGGVGGGWWLTLRGFVELVDDLYVGAYAFAAEELENFVVTVVVVVARGLE